MSEKYWKIGNYLYFVAAIALPVSVFELIILLKTSITTAALTTLPFFVAPAFVYKFILKSSFKKSIVEYSWENPSENGMSRKSNIVLTTILISILLSTFLWQQLWQLVLTAFIFATYSHNYHCYLLSRINKLRQQ
ncbi:MAG: hypothetical protein OEY96_07870 [Gammaproteobacteria bacterium]|nr:hypothetical protein [Gammaproteobacteria bacterium]